MAKRPIIIILDNIRSAFNVGSILRVCDAFNLSELLLTVYTACPPHRNITKQSSGIEEHVK